MPFTACRRATVFSLAIALSAGFAPRAFAQPPTPPVQFPTPQTTPTNQYPTPQTAPTTPPTAPEPTPAPATPQRERFRIGPEVGFYLPTDSTTRDAFGTSIFNIGFGIGAVHYAREQGEVLFDLNFISGRRGGSRLFMAPIGAAYRRSLTHITNSHQIVPYVGASANVFLVDIRADDYNVGGGVRTGWGGSAFAGLNFGQSAYLQARYYGFTRMAGFQLSGTNLSLGFRF